jgi:flagellar hook protein FlgE
MYSGISGMKVNQTKLDVIGNNIANVGTTAFKSQRARFSDMLSQNVKNAMAPTEGQGGLNSSQVGLGVQLASIDTVMSYGNLQSTGRALDVAIDQAGFFVVSNGPAIMGDSQLQVNHTPGTHTIDDVSMQSSNSQLMYSRDGSFILDNEGNLLTGDGYRVMGYSLTNDDSSKLATEVAPNTVSASGLDFKFGPGSQLNGFKVVLGDIGPNTITSATVDKVAKSIVVNGDFSTTGNLSSEQIQSAISKGLDAANISQQVTVTGNPRSIEDLGSVAVKGGADATAPSTVTVAGFTVRLGEGGTLNGYKFQVGKVNQQDIGVTVNTDPGVKTIIIDGDFITKGAINGKLLKDALNTALSNANVDQVVKDVSGVQLNLAGISAKTSKSIEVVAPTLTNDLGISGTSVNFGKLNISSDTTKGYGAGLNGYTLVFGDQTAGTALNVSVDKTYKQIRVDGDMTTVDATLATNLQTMLNSALKTSGIFSELKVAVGDLAGTSTELTFSNGVDYVKPKDIEIAQGLNISFPTATDKTIPAILSEYEVIVADVNAPALSVDVDTANKKILVSGNFVSPGQVGSTDLQTKINAELSANGITEAVKISGAAKVYTGLISDTVEGGEDLRSPDYVEALGLTFTATPGSQLNGYRIQVGSVTSGTKTSAEIDSNSKTITVNGDFVSGNITTTLIETALNNTLRDRGISQGISVSGSPIVLNGSESEEALGGTSVQSISANGKINYVDGTGTLSAYDNSLKSLKIPDKVIIPGSDIELRIKSYTIDKSGIINGVLEDGRVAALGQIAMANFKNPEGLAKLGGNLYNKSVNSGDPLIKSGVGTLGEDNSLGYGETIQSMLEMSNVDLAEQFTDMITATRAFQANGKIISTGDEVLQDIINLKR